MKWFMWVFMLAMNLLIPVTMIGFGRVFTKNPPRKINKGFGYRSKRSMKNQDAWDFAQRYMGKVWWKWGWTLLPLAVLGQALTLLCPSMESVSNWGLVLTTAETAVMMATIIPVERALKQTFDKDGNRL